MRDFKLVWLSRRATVLGGVAVLAAANARPGSAPHVLFVCLHGTAKSPIAREILRSQAQARGIAVQARSRGVDPEQGASAATAAALIRDGINVQRDPLHRLTKADARWADIIVYFDPLPFAAANRDRRDWTGTASVNAHYAEALEAIRTKIAALLDELAMRR